RVLVVVNVVAVYPHAGLPDGPADRIVRLATREALPGNVVVVLHADGGTPPVEQLTVVNLDVLARVHGNAVGAGHTVAGALTRIARLPAIQDDARDADVVSGCLLVRIADQQQVGGERGGEQPGTARVGRIALADDL